MVGSSKKVPPLLPRRYVEMGGELLGDLLTSGQLYV